MQFVNQSVSLSKIILFLFITNKSTKVTINFKEKHKISFSTTHLFFTFIYTVYANIRTYVHTNARMIY